MNCDSVQVRLLGPIDVVVGGQPRTVVGLRRNALIAALALHVGEPVGTDRLIRTVWGAERPATAVNTLQSHLSFIRGVLGTAVPIVNKPLGYCLLIPPGATDVAEVDGHIRSGKTAADPRDAIAHFTAALSLWRGSSLAEVAGLPWFHEQAERLDGIKLDATQGLIEGRLILGEHAPLVSELESLIEEHPFREDFHRQLMVALYRCDRQADALAAYRRLREILAEQLGIDPSVAVRELEAAILRQDPTLDAPQLGGLTPVSGGPRVPAQLPIATANFSGRTEELALLDELLTSNHTDESASWVVVAVISGMAGVGKSALAVHWAHEVVDRFPDGQLYANLRGFDPTGSIRESGEVVAAFLEALGVPPGRIPDDVEVQATLLRSLLAGKRVLMVLDNARDAEQVRPLLPGTARCLVVITSRNQLISLAATSGAHLLNLTPPAEAEAHAIFSERVGRARVAAEPQAAAEIVQHCARLPLALAIVAAHASSNRQLPLYALATQLREASVALDPFSAGDAATDIRAVLSWSYDVLKPEIAALFRRLALGPVPDVAVEAAANMLGTSVRHAAAMLTELTRVNLLTEPQPGRYAFHDLIRAYALEQSLIDDSDEQRMRAQDGMWTYYLHAAFEATQLLRPVRQPIALDPPPPGLVLPALPHRDSALRWFSAERSALKALITSEADDTPRRLWQLAWGVLNFLELRGAWEENLSIQGAALAAARRQGDRIGEAQALRAMGGILGLLGRLDEARRQTRRAVQLFHDLKEPTTAALAEHNLSWICNLQGRYSEALQHAQSAAQLCQQGGHVVGYAWATVMQAWCEADLHDLDKASAHARQAIDLLTELGDRDGIGAGLECLGYIHIQRALHRTAIDYFLQAADIYRDLSDGYSEATVRDRLGDAYAEIGEADLAVASWRRTLAIYDECGHGDTRDIPAKIAALTRRR